MAESRLRVAFRSLAALHRPLSPSPLLRPPISSQQQQCTCQFLTSIVQSRSFRSYPMVSLSTYSDKLGLSWSSNKIGDSNKVDTFNLHKEGEKLTIEVVFESCDYNHWWIGVVFPSGASLEERVRISEETCAEVLNISLEEAKQKIYACGDTRGFQFQGPTATRGFQALMTKEESAKFVGLPGVAFVLPDPFLDPNFQSRGDKDDNETFMPSPLPQDWQRYYQQGGYPPEQNCAQRHLATPEQEEAVRRIFLREIDCKKN